jgi:hypothetical protein
MRLPTLWEGATGEPAESPPGRAQVPTLSGDTAEVLAARVLAQEHRILPQAIRWFAEGRLKLQGQRVLLDGEPITAAIPGRVAMKAQPA